LTAAGSRDGRRRHRHPRGSPCCAPTGSTLALIGGAIALCDRSALRRDRSSRRLSRKPRLRPRRSRPPAPAPELPHLRPRPTAAPAAGPARLAPGGPPRLVRDRGDRRARPRAVLRRLPGRRPWSRGPRAEDDADAARAGDRAPLSRGRRLPGYLREPGARPRDDRPLSRPPPGRLADLFGQVLGLCAQAGLVAGVLAVYRTKVEASASNHATRSYERIAGRSLPRQDGSTPPRTSSTGRREATSSPPGTEGASGFGRPRSASSESEPRTPSQSPGSGRSGLSSAVSASSATGTRSARPIRRTRPTGSGG